MDEFDNQPIVDELAQIIWDYHQLNHTLEKSDCIMALGSNDPRVARRAADLFLDGWAPLIVFSGNVGALTAGLYGMPEADYFAKIAIDMGVPQERILIENKSLNTGQNIEFSKSMLAQKGIDPQSVILVQKPYMERRAYATFKKIWPDKMVTVTSPKISYKDYPFDHLSKRQVINILAGDLQRIKLYPAMGFQIEQEIPPHVWNAFEKLVALGFDEHLVKSPSQQSVKQV